MTADTIARFLLSQDAEKKYFRSSEGLIRLNIMMHLAHNAYLGKMGKLLIAESFYKTETCAVLPTIGKKYTFLPEEGLVEMPLGEQCVASFLNAVFEMLKDAPINRLIEIDKQDPAWQEASNGHVMDTIKHAKEYKAHYAATNTYIDELIAERDLQC